MLDKNKIQTLKIVLIGETGSGKSSLLNRFTRDQFDLFEPSTIGN